MIPSSQIRILLVAPSCTGMLLLIVCAFLVEGGEGSLIFGMGARKKIFFSRASTTSNIPTVE
jgi:hypothetical protein